MRAKTLFFDISFSYLFRMIYHTWRRFYIVGVVFSLAIFIIFFVIFNLSFNQRLSFVSKAAHTFQHYNTFSFRSNSFIRQKVNSSQTFSETSINVVQFKSKRFTPLDMQQIPISNNKTHVQLWTPRGHIEIFIHNILVDAAISKHIKESHVWEPEIVTNLVNILEKYPEYTFIDMGCNLGVYTLSVAKMGRSVIAVDPLYMNVENLYLSAKLGQFKSKIIIVNNAVSDGHTNVTLGIDRFNIGGTYVIENKNENKLRITAQGGHFIDRVYTITLDDILNIPEVTLSHVIMKIDVEGYELQVLRGGIIFFDNIKIGAIYMEWLFYKTGVIAGKIYSFLKSRNFLPHDAYFPEKRLDNVGFNDWPNDVIWKNNDLFNISRQI